MADGPNGSLPHPSIVYQAQGMVSVQADCPLDEALELMRQRAELSNQTLDEIARAVVEHRTWF